MGSVAATLGGEKINFLGDSVGLERASVQAASFRLLTCTHAKTLSQPTERKRRRERERKGGERGVVREQKNRERERKKEGEQGRL